MTDRRSERRTVLRWLGVGLGASALAATLPATAWAKTYKVSYSEAEWRRRLGKDRFYILREAGTERSFTSPLLKEKRKGTFHCAGCNNALYSSATKYDSRTGWPSFWKALPGAIGTSVDHKLGYARTEVHCADCGGHLGHIFDDGPKPTGKRHCINGLALTFHPA